MRVRGAISFSGAVTDISGAAVFVRLIDVSRADAEASTISEFRVLSLPRGTDTSKKIPFEFDFVITDLKASYVITAHVDVDRDGEVSVGDYITMQSIPFRAGSLSTFYDVEVRRIAP